jgi:flagellar basal body-associated protein FliL
MGEGLSNLADEKLRNEVKKEVNEILTRAIKK